LDTVELVNADIESGRRLVEALDRDGYDLAAAFWFYEPNAERWRLKIVPHRKVSGDPRDELIRIVRANNSLGGGKVNTGALEVVSKDAPLVQALGRIARVSGIGYVRLKQNAVNGIYIDDALVYRMAP
jgi:hypothetical protein